jgi:hypothetical protein
MTTAAVEKPQEGVLPLVRRTFKIREDQDTAIQSMRLRTGDSWSAIVRRALDLGLAAELESMRARRVPETDVA